VLVLCPIIFYPWHIVEIPQKHFFLL
jgi:hypothetical protein